MTRIEQLEELRTAREHIVNAMSKVSYSVPFDKSARNTYLDGFLGAALTLLLEAERQIEDKLQR